MMTKINGYFITIRTLKCQHEAVICLTATNFVMFICIIIYIFLSLTFLLATVAQISVDICWPPSARKRMGILMLLNATFILLQYWIFHLWHNTHIHTNEWTIQISLYIHTNVCMCVSVWPQCGDFCSWTKRLQRERETGKKNCQLTFILSA